MLDIRRIRDEYEAVRENLERRGTPELLERLEKTVELDEEWRSVRSRVDELRHQRNVLSEAMRSIHGIDFDLYDWYPDLSPGPPDHRIPLSSENPETIGKLLSGLIEKIQPLEELAKIEELPLTPVLETEQVTSIRAAGREARRIYSELIEYPAHYDEEQEFKDLVADAEETFATAWAAVATLEDEVELLHRLADDTNEELESLENELEELEARRENLLMRLPNLLHESVPYGEDDEDNEEVKRVGEPSVPDHELLPHGELIERQGLADFDRAGKVSGAGFAYLKGDLVRLDRALQEFALDHLVEQGFEPISVPLMMRREPYEGVTDLADFEDVMYKVEDHDEYLIATSEHPLGAMFMDEIIDEDELPIKLVGISACFRREIGSHGIDTKGLFRMHQFNKVEQFVFADPEESWSFHEELLENAEHCFQQLEIPYRVVNVCTGDIGTVAAKKYDIEAWSPRAETFREVVSCSNCTDYQARRLNVRAGKHGGDKETAHTLNATAIATSRAMVMILENHQNEDGTVTIPEALRPYMGGQKVLGESLDEDEEDGEEDDGDAD